MIVCSTHLSFRAEEAVLSEDASMVMWPACCTEQCYLLIKGIKKITSSFSVKLEVTCSETRDQSEAQQSVNGCLQPLLSSEDPPETVIASGPKPQTPKIQGPTCRGCWTLFLSLHWLCAASSADCYYLTETSPELAPTLLLRQSIYLAVYLIF